MTQLITLSGNPPSHTPEPPPRWRLIDVDRPGGRPLVFVVKGSRLFGVERDLFEALQAGVADAERVLMEAVGETPRGQDFAARLPEPAAISLNIAQSCNLSCTYCYADEGRFGGKAQFMAVSVAFQAIDRLIDGAQGRKVTVGFIGGEPFLNREVLYESVAYTRERARAKGCTAGFSATTNGTLINADDVRLLRDNGFVVSVSLDGGAILNDRHRRASSGVSGFDMALSSLRPLLENPGKARVAVRATVARDDLRVAERIEELAEAGFTEIGVSPLRRYTSAAARASRGKAPLESIITHSCGAVARARQGLSFRPRLGREQPCEASPGAFGLAGPTA